MMFRLLNALERVVSLENVVGNIAVNLSSQLQIIVEKIETLDQKVEALRKVNVHKMAAADFDHHKSVVETIFKELPVKSMDVSLRDNTLAISLVTFRLFFLLFTFFYLNHLFNSHRYCFLSKNLKQLKLSTNYFIS